MGRHPSFKEGTFPASYFLLQPAKHPPRCLVQSWKRHRTAQWIQQLWEWVKMVNIGEVIMQVVVASLHKTEDLTQDILFAKFKFLGIPRFIYF